MATFVALLRGINVGGNKAVKMAALKALCTAAGFADARTLLQSGNVVFAATGEPRDIAGTLESAIRAEFGFPVAVIVRTAGDLDRIVADNPFGREATDDPGHLVVMFLDRDAEGAAVARLAADHEGPETIASGDQALYIYYPDGIGRSKLTNALIEKRIGVTGTARNWNTVTKLLAMTEASGAA